MAFLRKKKGRYYSVFYDAAQQPKEKWIPTGTGLKDAARKVLHELERRWLDPNDAWTPWNPIVEREMLSVREAAARFMASRQHLRPKTVEAYRFATEGLLERLPAGLMIRNVQPGQISPYIDDLSVSVATRRHRYGHLRTFFLWAVEKGYLDDSPMRTVRCPKPQKKLAEFLSPEQLEQVLAAIDWDFEQKRRQGFARDGEIQWLKDLILLAVGTGLRLRELTSLRWSAVDFETGFLTVRNSEGFRTKSGHERAVPLAGDALDVLQRRNRERTDDLDGPVLTYGDGRAIVAGYASKRFKYYVRLAKLPEQIHFHSMRHTCASWLVMRGVPLSIVQQILGHSSIQVTERYAHLAPDVMKAAMLQAFGNGSGVPE